MRLTREEFDILSEIAVSKKKLTRKVLAEKTKYSPDNINEILKILTKKGYIKDGKTEQKGLDALEPYRVRHAILMAAGFGSRMLPITINTPKPLVRVNGVRIIDTLIDACKKAEIEEIYVVRGYLWEQFDQLSHKYPMIKFIENPAYNKTNNISSVMAAKRFLKNTYILEADLFALNPGIIKKYQYSSNFLGIKMDKSDDWCFLVKDGYITYQGVGGEDCYQEVGIAYIDKHDSVKLSRDLTEFYKTEKGKNTFWDYVLFSAYKEHFKIAIRECNKEDVIEIDTFDELKALDSAYNV